MYRPAYHQVTIAFALLQVLQVVPGHSAALLTSRLPTDTLNATTHLLLQQQRGVGVGVNDMWRASAAVATLQCRDFPGLSREQFATCLRYPHETSAALMGLRLAIAECQYQFRWHRWNCSTLQTSKIRNPHSMPLLKRGYRESAFAFAVSSAGVMYAVSRACSMGHLPNCGCGLGVENNLQILEPTIEEQEDHMDLYADEEDRGTIRMKRGTWNNGPRGQWQWGGCSHNLQFGARFSSFFLDSRETRGSDLQSHVNLHNNRAGRLAVLSHIQMRCKCHGLSGSCEVRTCWRAPPEFRRVGDALKSQFRTAVRVAQGNVDRRREQDQDSDLDNRLRAQRQIDLRQRRRRQGEKSWQQLRRRKAPNAQDLLYFQRSPSFCDNSVEFPGTTGRRCHKNSSGIDGCSSLCCGRGYNIIRQRRLERCLCRFQWCCQVTCSNCTIEEWVTVCK